MANKHKQPLIELDGTTLEGGGQLIRIALSLSALTSTPVKIYNIRGKRSGGGGLKPQHLACVNWLAHACTAYVEGAEKGSKTLLFEPWSHRAAMRTGASPSQHDIPPVYHRRKQPDGTEVYECELSIGTAGSTGLALQAVLPFMLFRPPSSTLPVHIELSGGTNVSGSMSFEYISQVLLPTLRNIGIADIRETLHSRGWSHGRTSIGCFGLQITPREAPFPLPAFSLLPSNPSSKSVMPPLLRATFIGPASVHEHLRTLLTSAIQHHFGEEIEDETDRLSIELEESGHDKRLYLILVAIVPSAEGSSQTYRLARDWLYERKIRSLQFATTEMAERVTNELAQEWRSGARVDEHMRDQLVVFQALAAGKSAMFAGYDEDGEIKPPSLHAQTAEWVAREMLGAKFNSSGACKGVGYTAPDAYVEEEMDTLDNHLAKIDLSAS